MVILLDSHPEVKPILQRLLENAKSILDRQWIGLYIHGSLAYGDFATQTSDIDFLIVTNDQISEDIFQTLKEMHERLFCSGLPWSQKLEGAYIPVAQIRCHNPTHPPVPWLGVDGHFAWETLGSDWILQRWILREKGVVIAGPSLKDMIDPVISTDLKEAVLSSLREWWSPPFPSPERFESKEYRAYAILTMCRSLYVLEHGCIASKPEAAQWSAKKYPEWASLIEEALHGKDCYSIEPLKDVFEFICFTLELANVNH